MILGNFVPYIIKTLRGDAHSREDVRCRKRPRSARECAKAHSYNPPFRFAKATDGVMKP